MGIDEERAAEGVAHLRAAAVEMIEAARAFLDVAEELVSDPEVAAKVMDVVGDAVDLAAHRARARSEGTPADEPEEASRIQRINLG